MGLSRLLRDGILGSLGEVLVAVGSVHALYGIGALKTRMAGASLIVRKRRAGVQRGLWRFLPAAAAAGLALSSLDALGLADDLRGFLSGLLALRLAIGDAQVSAGALLAAAAVLLATYAMAALARLVLEEEALPRLDLTAGACYAISAIARYLIALAGFVLAAAAAGIDLGKVALVLSAVGVGVGLGLQSLVNNFVSGLILLVERPMHVGDTIEVGALTCTIQRIGIRSSTVRTFQGAAVIVPNADLVAKELVNWTLSDYHRRLEIDVSVAKDADLDTVFELLRAQAAQDPAILDDPPPSVVLRSFGENSLDFRLYAWVDRFENGLAVQSGLRRKILGRIREAGIAR